MSNHQAYVQLASVPHSDDWVAEIWIGDSQLSEVRKGTDGTVVEIHPKPEGGVWTIYATDHVRLINEAVRRLDEGE